MEPQAIQSEKPADIASAAIVITHHDGRVEHLPLDLVQLRALLAYLGPIGPA